MPASWPSRSRPVQASGTVHGQGGRRAIRAAPSGEPRIAARIAGLQPRRCGQLLAPRAAEEARLAELREWEIEERRSLAQTRAAGGPAGLFRPGPDSAGCVRDRPVAGATIKGDLHCSDVHALGGWRLGEVDAAGHPRLRAWKMVPMDADFPDAKRRPPRAAPSRHRRAPAARLAGGRAAR